MVDPSTLQRMREALAKATDGFVYKRNPEEIFRQAHELLDHFRAGTPFIDGPRMVYKLDDKVQFVQRKLTDWQLELGRADMRGQPLREEALWYIKVAVLYVQVFGYVDQVKGVDISNMKMYVRRNTDTFQQQLRALKASPVFVPDSIPLYGRTVQELNEIQGAITQLEDLSR